MCISLMTNMAEHLIDLKIILKLTLPVKVIKTMF